ncbi:histone-lysine N-methyltransferase SETMAR [Trichonephila clavipes]|nr:histone-lysine N-methyltransferase SETMAR [Trichonephila clavipes]
MLIEVSDVIREKCKKEFRMKVILFHHDNARPHVSAMTSWTLYTLEWGFDATSTIQARHGAFGLLSVLHLQLHLEGTIFHSNEKVINEVNRFLDSCTSQFFAEGIEKLSKRWQIIVDFNGYPH